ncbi:hypothetical protein LUW75_17615 [Streptomyces sp. MRC013]|uniref:hypothetical protein n=1 Tax=Streptomyces sp. MRC013 TaxID=2898276 RepID=UPI00202641C2|nr:hypothetical protein [Streptomyces sp. MRC013]URM91491.1 hypothetical protein LUW75_17615 [Streptomyces sp. MRC013]
MTTTPPYRPGRIVSGSGLPALLAESPDAVPLFPSPSGPALSLTSRRLRDELLPRWREGVRRRAEALVRRCRDSLAPPSGGAPYDGLDDPEHRRAALVAELFRDRRVSANAERLDTRALQRRVTGALSADEPPRLELAWGQPKREVGGLKTAGRWADLAEVYAVGRLAALVLAARELAGDGRIGMTVYSGGNRFAAALFAEPGPLLEYDAQRGRIAEALAGPGVVDFRDFAAAKRSDPAEREAHEERVRRRLAALTDEDVAAQMPVMLFNVDWPRVLSEAARGGAPHGVHLAPHVARWLRESPRDRTPLLVRAAVTCAVSPAVRARWAGVFGDRPEVLEDAVAFALAMGRASAARYTAIARADREAPGRADGPHTVRLTVHEKTDRPEVPALLTLGPGGGGQLSQHVTARVPAEGPVTFASLAETLVHDPGSAPVLLEPDGGAPGLFDWLSPEGQPLCFASGPEPGVRRTLARLLDPEHG